MFVPGCCALPVMWPVVSGSSSVKHQSSQKDKDNIQSSIDSYLIFYLIFNTVLCVGKQKKRLASIATINM